MAPANKRLCRPDIVLTLIRTPHLPPKYASFWVPLWFNKLDMKDYLSRVYRVNVIHVRSYVQQQKIYREQVQSRGYGGVRPGRLLRPMAKKKMTVELEEPFVWPAEVTDYSPYVSISFKVQAVSKTNSFSGGRRIHSMLQKKSGRRGRRQDRLGVLNHERSIESLWQTKRRRCCKESSLGNLHGRHCHSIAGPWEDRMYDHEMYNGYLFGLKHFGSEVAGRSVQITFTISNERSSTFIGNW